VLYEWPCRGMVVVGEGEVGDDVCLWGGVEVGHGVVVVGEEGGEEVIRG